METVEPTPADVVPLLKGTHTHTHNQAQPGPPATQQTLMSRPIEPGPGDTEPTRMGVLCTRPPE